MTKLPFNHPFLSLLLASVLIFALFPLSARAQNVDEILNKAETARRVPHTTADVQLVTTEGKARDEKNFRYWRKLDSDGQRFKTFTRFSAPATIRNQAILFLERDGYRSDVFLYLPTFKRVRRVESHSQSSSFMGSAFSYSDIATPLASDFKNKLVKTENCPVGGGSCFVVENIPKSDDVKSRTGYARSLQWITNKTYVTVQWEFYGDDGKVRKVMQATEVKPAGPGRFMAHRLEIKNVQANKSTVLAFSKVNNKDVIADSIFTQQNLSRER